MGVQLFKTDSIDALLSLYMFFLKKEGGFIVTYENRGGKMSGGDSYFEKIVQYMFLAFIFFIAINIKFPQNSAQLHEALNKAAKDPESVVTDLIENNKDKLLEAEEIIEEFGLRRVNEIEDNDYKIEDNITDTINPIFKQNTPEAILEGVISVASHAMKILEPNLEDVYSSNTETVPGENTTKTLSPKRGYYLKKYIEDYEKAVRTTNEKGSSPKRNDFSTVDSTLSAEMPGASTVSAEMPSAEIPSASEKMSSLVKRYSPFANKRGGSKTKGQKRKIVESKRKRGGSKKQKRRSHKRR